MTEDKDFGELVFRQRLVHAGVLLIRLAGLPALDKAELVSQVLRDHPAEMAACFAVLSLTALRIRRRNV